MHIVQFSILHKIKSFQQTAYGDYSTHEQIKRGIGKQPIRIDSRGQGSEQCQQGAGFWEMKVKAPIPCPLCQKGGFKVNQRENTRRRGKLQKHSEKPRRTGRWGSKVKRKTLGGRVRREVTRMVTRKLGVIPGH